MGISRGSVYYLPRPYPGRPRLMRHRRLHLEHPFAGSRMLRDLLARGVQGRTPTRGHADAADGNRGAVPPPHTTKPDPATRSIRICCAG